MPKNPDKTLTTTNSFADMIGRHWRMQKIYNLIEAISPTATTVLITGETGTGKELVARAIHRLSPRKYKSFIKIDCTALPESLLESELFGYKKGAFTDARYDKPGKFEMSDSGTIFLDEIGDIPLAIQAKLLRVLEEQAFEPLGSIATVRVDIRIIAATNRNLKQAMDSDRFRKDLYYRLKIFPIDLPPLRERPEDIPLLVEYFINQISEQLDKKIMNLDKDVTALLVNYPWPGNVRELKHTIEFAIINCEGNIVKPHHLPAEIKENSEFSVNRLLQKPEPINEIEKELITEALRRNNASRAKTAKALRISRTTLWRKIKKHNII